MRNVGSEEAVDTRGRTGPSAELSSQPSMPPKRCGRQGELWAPCPVPQLLNLETTARPGLCEGRTGMISSSGAPPEVHPGSQKWNLNYYEIKRKGGRRTMRSGAGRDREGPSRAGALLCA